MPETKFRFSRQVREITVTLDYEDTTATELFTLPKNARVIAWLVNVTTAFSGGTTELDVGTNDDADYFLKDFGIGSVGQNLPTTEAEHPGHEPTVMTPVYATVGSGNSAGELELTCVFSIDVGTPLA